MILIAGYDLMDGYPVRSKIEFIIRNNRFPYHNTSITSWMFLTVIGSRFL